MPSFMRTFLIPLAVVLLQSIILVTISVFYYSSLPQEVAIGFNNEGHPTKFQDKIGYYAVKMVLFFPLVYALVALALFAVPRIPLKYARGLGDVAKAEKENPGSLKLFHGLVAKATLWFAVFTAQLLLEIHTLSFEIAKREKDEIFWMFWMFFALFSIELLVTFLILLFRFRSALKEHRTWDSYEHSSFI
ncbi:hypothetical protein K493DRAFT_79825 [Basidiobolus meristosporus CBS 931.73]|uniref:DUF1648 domain-containing protein n=1 Tax=Basidiobolus meristosporus CBS 931.73 TaxID=1314790 RepID=A0A1Y1XQK1_9FUNG|nr:hypothetical protein K493DRAFT_79825 [Basidiobolus meristosporus CBS 931.73]|eukprot:ORX88049.1 hypothetical protein K493DRAFT_79825 [Basidiobolus meristosporus CBS 931.73]